MRTIPARTLSAILGRSEDWMRRVWQDRRASPFPPNFCLMDALLFLTRMPKRTRVWKCKIDLKLPLITWKAVRNHCYGKRFNEEDFFRGAALDLVDELWRMQRDITKDQPSTNQITRGYKRTLRHFVLYAWLGVKIIAFCFDTSMSAVMDWAVWNSLTANEYA